MLFQTVGCITDTAPCDDITSRLLTLTPGSRYVRVRYRKHNATAEWSDGYESSFNLAYPFSGDAEVNIWLLSDVHTGHVDHAPGYFTGAITDIDGVVTLDYAFVLGDITQTGVSGEFTDYKTARDTSDLSRRYWYEVCGNHDYEVGVFKSELDYDSLYYTVDIENIHFIIIGENPPGEVWGEMPSEFRTFLDDELADNTDKNLIVLTHFGVKDTTYITDSEYLTPDADIQVIIAARRIDAWFCGHMHYDARDDLIFHDTFALYDGVDISHTIYTGHLALSDSLEISESLGIKFCYPGANQSKFGTFVYGQRKYGMNVSICEKVAIVENLLIKFNGTIIKGISDTIAISESLSRTVEYNLPLADSLAISDSPLAPAGTIEISLADSLTISEAVLGQNTLSLSDSIDFGLSLEIESTEAVSYKTMWRFLVKDSSGNVVASLVNARNRWFVERLNQQGEAGFILDADDANCNTTILNLGVNELYIYYKESLMWAGQLVSARKIAKGDDIYWEVLAKDWVALLGKRFCGVESVREFTTTDAGVVAWTLIDEAQDLANGDFGITEGTIESSINRSSKYDKKNVLAAIRELSNQGRDGEANYGFDFEITPQKVFNVYYPYKGTIRNGVVFRYPGNCEDFEAFVDTWGIVNHEWGMGRHWTGETAIVSRSDATSQTTYKRREAIKSYNDMSVLAFLQDMVWQDIQWLKDPQTIIRFEARVDNKVGINDYNVGDGVTVICDKFDIDEWLWVYERKTAIGDNDEPRVTLVVGN